MREVEYVRVIKGGVRGVTIINEVVRDVVEFFDFGLG